MENKNKIVILTIALLLMISIGATYAYFTANITGEETTSITVTGGKMTIVYDGGAPIVLSDIIPDNEPVISKRFTVTGNNTTDIEMAYELSLIVESNSFSENALKYKLTGNNAESNGKLVPDINELTNIGSGAKTIVLGQGEFLVPTDGDKVHSYNLEIFFPSTNTNQNVDQEKVLKARVGVKNYISPCAKGDCLKDLIIAQGGGASEIESKPTPNYGTVNTPSGLFSAEDEYGTSYYFRGNNDELNNNLVFANSKWKIVRINGNGTVRVIYNGALEGTDKYIGISPWYENHLDDNKYLGYMHGTQTPSTSRNEAVANENSSTLKNVLDQWYQNNILTSFNQYVADEIFCNNREFSSEVGSGKTDFGYGKEETYYSSNHNLDTNKTPSLKCNNQNDKFTVGETGNGALTYPVGLITADELSFAGFVLNTPNNDNYLLSNVSYWTMTPSSLISIVEDDFQMAEMFIANEFGMISTMPVSFSENITVRPVLNLKFDIKVSGTGTNLNPYEVKL